MKQLSELNLKPSKYMRIIESFKKNGIDLGDEPTPRDIALAVPASYMYGINLVGTQALDILVAELGDNISSGEVNYKPGWMRLILLYRKRNSKLPNNHEDGAKPYAVTYLRKWDYESPTHEVEIMQFDPYIESSHSLLALLGDDALKIISITPL